MKPNTDFIKQSIKQSFENLVQFKERENSLEIITPYSTVTDKFISVFVVFQKGKIVINDNTWFHQNYYAIPDFDEKQEFVKKIIDFYAAYYQIKQVVNKDLLVCYYKICENESEINNAVVELACFLMNIINMITVENELKTVAF